MVGGACGFHPCPGVRAFSPDISSEQKTRPEVPRSRSLLHMHVPSSPRCGAINQVSAPHGFERHIAHKSRFRRIRDLQILQRASQHPSRRRWRSNELIFSKLC